MGFGVERRGHVTDITGNCDACRGQKAGTNYKLSEMVRPITTNHVPQLTSGLSMKWKGLRHSRIRFSILTGAKLPWLSRLSKARTEQDRE